MEETNWYATADAALERKRQLQQKRYELFNQIQEGDREIEVINRTYQAWSKKVGNEDSTRSGIYTYKPLAGNEIRLLKLLPGDTDTIHVIISHEALPSLESVSLPIPTLAEIQRTLPADVVAVDDVNRYISYWALDGHELGWEHPDPNHGLPLEEASNIRYKDIQPKYEALSYCWGEDDTTFELVVLENGVSATEDPGLQNRCHINIGRNLHDALRCLRHSTESRVLWVDAVCINQADFAERSEQVCRMSEIYRLAYRVIGWVGLESNESKIALEGIGNIGTQVRITNSGLAHNSGRYCMHPDWYSRSTPPPFDSVTLKAIESLMQRQWFSRLWILQEIQLTNYRATIQCGPDTLEFRTFRCGVLVLANKTMLPGTLSQILRKHSDMMYNWEGRPLPYLLRVSGAHGCSDPKDKIYGILGMAPPKFAARIRPQYALSILEVYKNAFLVHLEQTQRLDLLQFCQGNALEDMAPSWIPDWSGVHQYYSSWSLATGLTRAYWELRWPACLEVWGVKCGVFSTISDTLSTDSTELASQIQDLESQYCSLSSGDQNSMGEDLLKAFRHTITCGDLEERIPGSALFQGTESYSSNATISRYQQLGNSREAHFWTLRKIMGRKFATTTKGNFGIVPRATALGDIACSILGCPSLIVLRPTQSGGFRVIGEAYVHGFADAEGILGPVPKPWRFQIKQGVNFTPSFLNTDTGKSTPADPRLPPLPYDWTRVEGVRDADDPEFSGKFRSRVTGETLNWDPQLSLELLRERCKDLMKLVLE